MYFDDDDQYYVEDSDGYHDYDPDYYDDDDYYADDNNDDSDTCSTAASEESSESEATESLVSTLYDAALNVTARMLPFESVEIFSNHVKRVPEDVQLSIMKAAFPQKKAIISRYAHLSRKSARVVRDYCSRQSRWTVKEGKQIGFVVVADVAKSTDDDYTPAAASVAINFDRRKITSASCSKHGNRSWCRHIVQAIYHRIECPSDFIYRFPISHSIQQLSEFQQKQFLCRLLSSYQPHCLGLAQTVLDEYLEAKENLPEAQGCVDATAGGAIGNEPEWSLSRITEDESPDVVGRCFAHTQDHSKIKSWQSLIKAVKESLPGKRSRASDTPWTVVVSVDRRSHFGCFLSAIKKVLRKKDDEALSLLSKVTDMWLACLEEKSSKMALDSSDEHETSAANVGDKAKRNPFCPCPLWAVDPQISNSTFSYFFDSRNSEILSSGLSLQTFPDELMTCHQFAALCPNFSLFQREVFSQNTEEWMVRLNAVIRRGLELTNRFQGKLSCEERAADKRLWRGFYTWNGFSHTGSLFSSGVAEFLCKFVKKPLPAEVSLTETMLSFHQHGEIKCFLSESFLKTICIICNALMHFNFACHSKLLAECAAVGYLLAVGTDLRTGANAATSVSQDLLEALRKLCGLETASLWPSPSGDLVAPLLLLWKIITKLDADVWKDTSLRLSKKRQDTAMSWIVAFALKCLAQSPETIFDTEIDYVNDVGQMLAQHAVISDIISHAQDTEMLVLSEWLLESFHDQSLSLSNSLVFLTISLLEPQIEKLEEQSLSLVLHVACSWLQNRSWHLRNLVEIAIADNTVCHSSLRNLYEFFSTLRFVLPRCCSDDDVLVQAVISPLRQCFSLIDTSLDLLPPSAVVKDAISYIFNCAFETLTTAAGISTNYHYKKQELENVFTALNLPRILEMFSSAKLHRIEVPVYSPVNNICQKGSDVLTPIVRILIELSTAMHSTGSSMTSHYIVRVLTVLQYGRIKLGFSKFISVWDKATSGDWALIASPEDIVKHLLRDKEGLPNMTKEDAESVLFRKTCSLLVALSASSELEKFTELLKFMKATTALFRALDTDPQPISYPAVLFWLTRCVSTDSTVENLRKRYRFSEVAYVRYKALLASNSEISKDLLAKLQNGESVYDRSDPFYASARRDDNCNYCIKDYCRRCLREGKISQRNICLLSGLACRIDQKERKATLNESYMATADSLFQLILDEWIDPLLSFNVLVVVSHLAYDKREAGTILSSASNTGRRKYGACNDIALFPRFFEKGRLRRLRRISANGSMLIEKCKTAFVQNLQSKNSSASEHSREQVKDYFPLRPNLNVLCCDIIALDFLIEAFPDTSISMGKLLDTSSDSSGFSVDDKEEIRLFQQLKGTLS